MSVNFLMLLAAALILRYLGMRARAMCVYRLTRLLGNVVSGRPIETLLRQHPQQAENFRARILPYAGLRLLCDALACGTFLLGVFFFPPAGFGPRDLAVLQYGSAVVVAVALLIDAALYCRTVVLAWDLKGASEETE